jgi:hypothetical protein
MKKRLGVILTEKGIATSEQIDEALRVQVGGNRRLGYILIKMGVISDDQLMDVLSQQMDVPIISIEQEFKDEVKSVLPKYLCQKYTLLPVSKGNNNILNIAMVDPSDEAAIADIEGYTGMVVKPMLARAKDISAAINRFIPFSLKDIFNPQVYGRFAKIATSVALVLLIVIGWVSYHYIMNEKYGSISVVGDTTTYKNHDLMVGVENDGKISLLGHGAYTKGFYSVDFASVETLKTFVEQKRKNFSDKQAEWLLWVINTQLTGTKKS